MTIYRTVDGRQLAFELTEDEIRDAYDEQQGIYDLDDIEAYLDMSMDWIMDRFPDMAKEKVRDAKPEFVKAYRHAINNGAFEFEGWELAGEVISDVLRDNWKVDYCYLTGED